MMRICNFLVLKLQTKEKNYSMKMKRWYLAPLHRTWIIIIMVAASKIVTRKTSFQISIIIIPFIIINQVTSNNFKININSNNFTPFHINYLFPNLRLCRWMRVIIKQLVFQIIKDTNLIMECLCLKVQRDKMDMNRIHFKD